MYSHVNLSDTHDFYKTVLFLKLSSSFYVIILYAIQIVADLEIPALQWTKIFPSSLFSSSAKNFSYKLTKKMIKRLLTYKINNLVKILFYISRVVIVNRHLYNLETININAPNILLLTVDHGSNSQFLQSLSVNSMSR